MKGIRLIFTCFLALWACVEFGAIAATETDNTHGVSRRGTSVVSAGRQTSSTSTRGNDTTTTSSRTSGTSSSVRNRDTTPTGRSGVVVRETTPRTTATNTGDVSARTATTVLPRGTTKTGTVVSVPARTTTARTGTTTVSRTATQNVPARATTISRTATPATKNVSRTATTSRDATARRGVSATTARAGITAEEIMNRDYTTCREVYYSCMDEFCANKDSQLKRCACSSRVNEFDDVKEQLTEIEDRLLDFNQRLLTVNMDREDAEALFQATEGELAFQQEDTSASKELLDEISEKLNDTFDTSTFDANLSPITLTLNVDAAFDSVDSLAGAGTTLRTGPDLYSAALPVCREMAMEVCTDAELDIVESGYQMAIEQDCNTVAKAYETQQQQAREKIREGSALLDMSRLDIYQKRNSDDILTCKSKMLDMLTNTSVCGPDLQQCLDISGQYIDPSTGQAILTSNLVNLNNLISRPGPGQTWTGAPGNYKFVQYLESKKMFLESATENCQDIADHVWDDFIEDALAQIKLAQEEKMEEVRQGCTTLTTQCLTDSAESLEEFDARALSIFGVEADKTVKQMCAQVQTACTALLDTVDGGTDWDTGMTEIATDKTYETIMQTCREVGRSCIIQSCKSISGNFGLCENIETSVNRKAIINRTACWNEVLDCVASAGLDSINKITDQYQNHLDAETRAFYTELYGSYNIADITNDELEGDFAGESCILGDNGNCIFDICADECGYNSAGGATYSKLDSDECQVCRLAERIWGNCEAHPASNLSNDESHNQIKIPLSDPITGEKNDTLLSWFARNTNTEDSNVSCRDTSCGPGYTPFWDPEAQSTVCVLEANISDDGMLCPLETFWRFNTGGGSTNCCRSGDSTPGKRDAFGNCCLGSVTGNSISHLNWETTTGYSNSNATGSPIVPTTETVAAGVQETAQGFCLPSGATFVMAFPLTGDTAYYGTGIGFLFCVGSISASNETTTYPSGQTLTCSGDFIVVTKDGRYMIPHYSSGDATPMPDIYYRGNDDSGQCNYTYSGGAWSWSSNDGAQCTASPKNYIIQY